jgi:hypothetical protein
MMIRVGLNVSLLVVIALSSHPVYAEQVTISRLLADPQPYNLKVITLTGTAHQIHLLRDAPETRPRLDFQCYLVHPPYTFVLADETGFLQITVRGRPPCVSKHSPAEPPDVSDGNKVSIDAQITVSLAYSAGVASSTVEALALGIRRLDE